MEPGAPDEGSGSATVRPDEELTLTPVETRRLQLTLVETRQQQPLKARSLGYFDRTPVMNPGTLAMNPGTPAFPGSVETRKRPSFASESKVLLPSQSSQTRGKPGMGPANLAEIVPKMLVRLEATS